MKAVTVALLSNEKWKMTPEFGMQIHDIALVVKAKKEAKILTTTDRKKKLLSKVECFYCYRKEHTNHKCQKLQNDLKEMKSQNEKIIVDQDEETTTMAQAAESEMIDFNVLYVVTGGAKISDYAQVIDSTCSFHVCLDMSLLPLIRRSRVE